MYSLQDFVLFNTEAWFGLYQTINSQYWPLQIVGLLWGLFVIYAFFNKEQFIVIISFVGLACLWFSSGIVFHLGEYQQLSWVAEYYGWAFLSQGMLLLISAILVQKSHQLFLIRDINKQHIKNNKHFIYAGFILIGAGILLTPILGLMEGREWQSLDVLGVGPDSTALVTTGFILVTLQNKILKIILCLVPSIWLIISAATAWPMGLFQGVVGLFIWLMIVLYFLILARIK